MRRTILLADDSPTIHRLVTNTFADADFEIVSVSNGEAAVRKFEEIHPHVVLADIYMPGRTGFEVCSYVRQHPSVSNTPVILLVGAFDVFDEKKAQELGATGHITKPFEPQALVSLVESLLPPEDVASEETLTAVTPPDALEEDTPKIDSPAQTEAAGNTAVLENEDLLGLTELFPEPVTEAPAAATVTDADIDRIADRVLKRLSSQVIETIAWELVPDIAERVVREELKRTHET
jgi:CheY-like chemotaxis protein